MTPYEELGLIGIERCPECSNLCGDDWKYVDFSNKYLIQCPQCKTILDPSTQMI